MYGAAEGCECEFDGDLAVELIAVAFEDVMLLDVDNDVEVAGWSAAKLLAL